MTINFRPTGNHILIKQDAKSEKIGSIIVESASNRPPQSGVVLAVGPHCCDCKRGDRVQFELGEFQKVTLDGYDLIIVKESKIIGIFENE